MKHEAFKSWPEVIAHVQAGGSVWYQAPMDRKPSKVSAHVTATRDDPNGAIRVTPSSATLRKNHPDYCDPFDADSGHCDRFRYVGALYRAHGCIG